MVFAVEALVTWDRRVRPDQNLLSINWEEVSGHGLEVSGWPEKDQGRHSQTISEQTQELCPKSLPIYYKGHYIYCSLPNSQCERNALHTVVPQIYLKWNYSSSYQSWSLFAVASTSSYCFRKWPWYHITPWDLLTHWNQQSQPFSPVKTNHSDQQENEMEKQQILCDLRSRKWPFYDDARTEVKVFRGCVFDRD